MFIEQAVRQFEIWTGQPAPRPAMLKAAVEALEQGQNHNHNQQAMQTQR